MMCVFAVKSDELPKRIFLMCLSTQGFTETTSLIVYSSRDPSLRMCHFYSSAKDGYLLSGQPHNVFLKEVKIKELGIYYNLGFFFSFVYLFIIV